MALYQRNLEFTFIVVFEWIFWAWKMRGPKKGEEYREVQGQRVKILTLETALDVPKKFFDFFTWSTIAQRDAEEQGRH